MQGLHLLLGRSQLHYDENKSPNEVIAEKCYCAVACGAHEQFLAFFQTLTKTMVLNLFAEGSKKQTNTFVT